MPTTFRPYQPDQLLLLSPDLREWLPPGHLAHHVSDLVDALELRAFYAPYEGDGRRNAPYEPSMMVKVLIYAYATGVFSSRAIARKLEEDVAFRVLAAGNFPQHRTICEFRRRHLEDFERMFVEVVRVARESWRRRSPTCPAAPAGAPGGRSLSVDADRTGASAECGARVSARLNRDPAPDGRRIICSGMEARLKVRRSAPAAGLISPSQRAGSGSMADRQDERWQAFFRGRHARVTLYPVASAGVATQGSKPSVARRMPRS